MSRLFPYRLVTGNAGKLAEARRIVGPALEAVEIDLPEIQSLDLDRVLAAKAEAALAAIGPPVVVEETALELAVLGGFPGPLVKWMLAAIGAEGIARCALAMGDGRAAARCALLALDGERRIASEGATTGHLVLPPRGDRGFGWDPVFVPEGERRTYAEMSDGEKDAVGHRGRAWRALLEQI